MAKNDKYWRFATYNVIVLGTVTSAAAAFLTNEANKFILYQKYEREIAQYTKWRADRELRAYLLKPSELDV